MGDHQRNRTRQHGLFRALCVSAVNLSILSACGKPIQSTRLQTRDFQDISSEIAGSLRSSAFLRDRTPGSPPIFIAIQKIDNLTTDLLSEGEKWFLMDRVMNSETMAALRKERNIRFLIPMDALDNLNTWAGPIASDRAPTHTMTAVLRSVTRSAGQDRTDLYSAHYAITALDTGESVWTGEYLLKRTAAGR
ncbi:MAG: hypothetical protein JNK58_11905, partial [Phycisphaerae bacterium]|nr:hypothetical protein [Phycisphaerae bacterium]